MMKKLMERVRMIRENQKKNGTKGFSMIELIIVIAVMAILIALIGTQLIPYLEKSRQTRDLDTLSAALTGVQTVATDHELAIDTNLATNIAKYASDLNTYLGYEYTDCAGKFSSDAAKDSQKGLTISFVAASGKEAAYIKVSRGKLWVASNGTKSNGATAAPAGAP